MLNKRGKIIFIIAVLIATFLLVYFPHFNYPYPLHADEWYHLEWAKRLYSGHYTILESVQYQFLYQLSITPLFIIEKLSGISAVQMYIFLPAIFACFASILLFLLMYKLTKNYWISLFSIIFFASLPSDVNLLGSWFATPSSMIVLFIFLFFFLFLKAVEEENKKYLFYSMGVMFLIIFIHASVASFLLPVLGLYFLINYKRVKEKPYLLAVFLPFLIAFIIVTVIFKEQIIQTIKLIISLLIFKSGSTSLEPSLIINPISFNFLGIKFVASQYFLPVLYGIIPFLLALYGLYHSIKEEKLRIFAIWLISASFFLFIFNCSGISFFTRRQHMIYYALLALVPLSAIGLYNFILMLKNKLNNIQKLINKEQLKKVIIIFLIILVFAATFYNYGAQRKGTELYHLIQNEDYQAFIVLNDYPLKGAVMSPLKEAMAIYPISANYAFSKFYPGDNETADKTSKFFSDSSDCKTKEAILRYDNIKFVYSKFKIECEFLDEIYSDGRFVYAVKY